MGNGDGFSRWPGCRSFARVSSMALFPFHLGRMREAGMDGRGLFGYGSHRRG